MSGPVRRLLAEGRDQRSRLLLATALGAAATGSAIALMATSAWLISRAAQHPPVLTLMVAVVGVRAFAVGRGAFRYTERLVSHDAALRVLTALRIKVFAALEPLAPVSWIGARGGDLLSRLVGDVDTVLDLFVRVVLPIGAAFVVSAFAVVLVGWLLPVAGIALAVTLLVGGVVVPWVAARTGRRAAQLTAEARGDLASEVVDALSGSAELVAFGAADEHLARVAVADARLAALERSTAASTALAAGLGALAAGAGVWAALALGVPAVRGGSLQGVLLAVVVLTALAAPEAVAGLPGAADHLQRVRRGAQRLFAVVDAPAPVPEPRTPQSIPSGPAHVRLSGVSARYGPGGPLALRDVDLDLSPGKRVAVVGMSGAGKSTLVNVLLRFLDFETGSFTVNGIDVRKLPADDVRRVIGSCEQEPHLFDTSIRKNLLVAAPEASDDELFAALRRARIADWVAALPEGLDTLVGENGAAVSGGQLRRIALARALLADFPVLLLDEPTEGLPADVADELVSDLMEATKDRTVLLVTHRREYLVGLDEVLELEGGQVIARS
jgi:thiol reductant ABC exporter CydC subunit